MRGHPEVRGARVENDLELLGRRTNGDVGKVLRVEKVRQGDAVTLAGLRMPFAVRLVDGECGELVLDAGRHLERVLVLPTAILVLQHLNLCLHTCLGQLRRGSQLLKLGPE